MSEVRGQAEAPSTSPHALIVTVNYDSGNYSSPTLRLQNIFIYIYISIIHVYSICIWSYSASVSRLGPIRTSAVTIINAMCPVGRIAPLTLVDALLMLAIWRLALGAFSSSARHWPYHI